MPVRSELRSPSLGVWVERTVGAWNGDGICECLAVRGPPLRRSGASRPVSSLLRRPTACNGQLATERRAAPTGRPPVSGAPPARLCPRSPALFSIPLLSSRLPPHPPVRPRSSPPPAPSLPIRGPPPPPVLFRCRRAAMTGSGRPVGPPRRCLFDWSFVRRSRLVPTWRRGPGARHWTLCWPALAARLTRLAVTERAAESQNEPPSHRMSRRVTERPAESQNESSSHRTSHRVTERAAESQNEPPGHRMSRRVTE